MRSVTGSSRAAFIVTLVACTSIGAEPAGVRVSFHATKPSEDEKTLKITVSGKITDAKTGEPIPKARVRGHVTLWRHQGPDMFEKCPTAEVRTDEQGQYSLTFGAVLTTSGAMKGKDMVCIDAGAVGYETRPVYLHPEVTADHTRFPNSDIALQRGKLIKARVVDEQDRPIAAARVIIDQGLNGDWKYFASLGETATAADGRFEIGCTTDHDLFGPEPWLAIYKEGHGAGFFWDVLKKEDLGTLVLRAGGTIEGRVLDTKSAGVAGCRVHARDASQRSLSEAKTDADGRYVLRGVPGEQTFKALMTRKNGRWQAGWGEVTVFAITDAAISLRDTPQYRITAQDGKTLRGPDLKTGVASSVAGTLVASRTPFRLGELLVRLDYDWGHMVEADAEGRFRFPYVQPGKHRLTAYLPNNLRGDRGIGSVEVQVKHGESLANVAIPLETLTEVRVQILDEMGNPLEGITAGATWTKSGDGFWTEGTPSDKYGRAVLYLYPGRQQFVRGFDRSNGLVAEGFEAVTPEQGKTLENVRITMVRAATLHGRLMDEGGQVIANRRLVCRLVYADQAERGAALKTDSKGRFTLDGLTPGVFRPAIGADPKAMPEPSGEPFELDPGENKDIGTLVVRVPNQPTN